MIDRANITITETPPDEMGIVTMRAELCLVVTFQLDVIDRNSMRDIDKLHLKERLCDQLDGHLYDDARKAARDFFLSVGRLADYSSYEALVENKTKLFNALKSTGTPRDAVLVDPEKRTPYIRPRLPR